MYNAHLHVLHVAKERPLTPLQPTFPGTESTQTSDRIDPGLELRKFVEKMLPFQTKVIEAVRIGQPFKEIVTYARREDIDLIVIATHGRTGFTHLMMGSVAERVVRFSHVPVLTIKPPKHSHTIGSKSTLRQIVSEESLNDYSG